MSFDLSSLASNIWAVFLVILFFGGSIFVHELGHFLAARRRGVYVERFSIGFGPAIWSRRGKDGVEYRLAWFPLGGYVLLPQLADLGAVEGESTVNVAKLPPVSYSTRMLVFVAGAAFNVLFAFALACIIWLMGQPEGSDSASTRIGWVASTLELPDKTRVPGPAFRAGLQVGDNVIAIDGEKVENWSDVYNSLILSSGRDEAGKRQAIFTIERAGVRQDIIVEPVLATEEKIRKVGIGAGYELIVKRVEPGSLGAAAGFQPEDEILRLDDKLMINGAALLEHLTATANQSVRVAVRRAGNEIALTLPPHPDVKADPESGVILGLAIGTGFRIVHVPPHEQIADVARWTIRTLQSLVNRNSDVGLDKMSGPVGIFRILHSAAEIGLRAVFMITILLNVNLAIFNLLPIPVLDGGQMLFATIARLRGRSLPVNFIAATQSLFMVLLLCMVAYVTIFSDVPRAMRERRAERAAEAVTPAQKAPTPVK